LLLGVSRRVAEADSYIRTGRWKGWTPTLLEGRGLNGRVLGVIGLGRIGCAVARMANAFGMKVRYWSRNRKSPGMEKETGVSYRSFGRLLRESDFLSVHLALNDETRHLIGAAEFARMKQGAVIINTARGPILDEKALVAALRSGHLGGAGLDVFEDEPKPHPRLLRMKNVVMMPHLGTNTDLGRDAVSERVERNVKTYLLGKRPPDLLNPEAWPHRRR
ncbi:MAG: D-glycerate dehydrogenase, partial [Nitrospinae bacterium]|nr:D-glycerate dehydrogenase [Nitrospinota bacterium]